MTDTIIEPPTPPCFSTRLQFKMWMQSARITGGIYENGICTDCTAEYQAKMIEQKRCMHPDTYFAPDQDGFTQGVIPNGKTNTAPHTP
jgi:hypothetical protein